MALPFSNVAARQKCWPQSGPKIYFFQLNTQNIIWHSEYKYAISKFCEKIRQTLKQQFCVFLLYASIKKSLCVRACSVFAGVKRERQGVGRIGPYDPQLQVAVAADVQERGERGQRSVALHRRLLVRQLRPLPLRRLPTGDSKGRKSLAALLRLRLLPHLRHLRDLLSRPENCKPLTAFTK